MQVGDVVKLKSGVSAIEVIGTDYIAGELKGRYCSRGVLTDWRPMTDFEPIEYNPKEDTMNRNNNSALIALLQAQRGMTTAKVRLSGKNYTYKVQPGVTLEVDDYVVVQCGNTVNVGKVTEVDEFADIDLESGFDYKWVIQKVNLSPVKALVEEEKQIAKQFAAAEAQEKLAKVAQYSGIDLTKIETPMLEARKV